MSRRWFSAIVIGLLVSMPAAAGEREDYLLCVTDELGRGTDLSEIGDRCLEEIRPQGGGRAEKTAEEYPYEHTLREVLIAHGSLIDPVSAQFKDLVFSSRHNAWCGQVNSKNRLGGYVGWEYFAARDRYRGSGKRSDYIDFQIGEKVLVEKICKSYGAWSRENW